MGNEPAQLSARCMPVEMPSLGLRTVHYTATAVHYTVTYGIRLARIPSVYLPAEMADGTARYQDGRLTVDGYIRQVLEWRRGARTIDQG
jgi:hypothetical protein